MTTPATKDVRTENGPALGRVKGVNHLQLIVGDMAESVTFYRDLLGLRLVRTYGRYEPPRNIQGAHVVERNYYFDLGNGEILSLIEVEGCERPCASVFFPSYWPDGAAPPVYPSKLDHLALHVDTRADVAWFRQHLEENNVAVSKIYEPGGVKIMTSIYFCDPTGNPLEIATHDVSGSAIDGQSSQDRAPWLDGHPVPTIKA